MAAPKPNPDPRAGRANTKIVAANNWQPASIKKAV
jgi:hypothetical protein